MPTVLTMEATFTIERSRAINSVRIVAKKATKAEDVNAAVEKALQTGATGTAVMRALYDRVEQGNDQVLQGAGQEDSREGDGRQACAARNTATKKYFRGPGMGR